MKLVFIFVLVFFCALAGFAQTSSTQLPKASSPRPKKTLPDIRDAMTTLEDEEEDEEEGGRPWAVLFQSFNEAQAQAVNTRNFSSDAAGDALATNLMGLNYELVPNIELGVAQEWESTWGLGDNRARYRLNDGYVQLKDEEFFTIGRDIHSESYLRIYLPTGEFSRETGQILQVRYEASLEATLRRVTLRYVIRPEYHFQKYLAYYDTTDETVVGTKSFKLWNIAEAEYRLTSSLKLRQAFGLADTWYHGDANYGLDDTRSEDFIAETGLNWEASDFLAFELGIYQWAPDLLAQDKSFSVYRDDEANYYFYGEVTF